MALRLENLDERTRRFMLEELDYDLAKSKFYLSSRLNARGVAEYPELLRAGDSRGG